MAHVEVDITGHVATVVLNRPETRNAFSREMIDTFGPLLAGLGANPAVRAVVITGAGKGFSSGADFPVLQQLADDSGHSGVLATRAAVAAVYDVFMSVYRLPVPVVAAVNGAAVGGGLGIALLADVRIVADEAKLGANFARLGFSPGMGISALLPRLIGRQAAAELLLTGKLIRGPEAVRIGLARTSLPRDEVLPAAQALAAEMAAAAPLATRQIKHQLRRDLADLPDVLAEEALAQATLMHTHDAREGIAAMRARRDPVFEGR